MTAAAVRGTGRGPPAGPAGLAQAVLGDGQHDLRVARGLLRLHDLDVAGRSRAVGDLADAQRLGRALRGQAARDHDLLAAPHGVLGEPQLGARLQLDGVEAEAGGLAVGDWTRLAGPSVPS